MNRKSCYKKLARATDYEFETISKERIVELIQEGTIQLNLNDEGKISVQLKKRPVLWWM
ncbi:hypothetical protein ACT7DA_11970 [Bacillus pacificus]